MACCGRHREEAEDVLQAAYLKVLDGTARFEERSSFKTWLFGVIRLTALQRLRWQRVRERMSALLHVETSVEATEYSGEAGRLVRALAMISRRQREVIELVFYHGMTIEDASQTLGISLGSARVHYERGKKSLRKLLMEEGQIVFA